MKYRRRILPWVLMALGAVMALWAMVMLCLTPNVLQYTILAPEAGENNATINASLEKAKEVLEAQRVNYAGMALGGGTSRIKLSTDTGYADVNLIAMDEGWLEVYPRFLKAGRRISELELQYGTAVIVLDEDLVIRLFGSSLPESATVKLNEVEFSVVGAVRHGGSVFGAGRWGRGAL